MRSTWLDLRAACVAAAALLALEAFAADNPSPGLSPGPFLGRWNVIDAEPAPWVDPKDASTTPDFDKTLSRMTIVFAPTSIEAPRPFGCKKVMYELQTTEPEGLFEGGLKNPKADAAKLGFKDQKIPSLSEGCVSPQADFDMDFAMVDPDTIVFALNNVIYRLKRAP